MRNSALETRNSGQSGVEPPHSKKDPTPTFFWKCMKRKGFKSFVLKVCETKGVADAFLRKCVNLKQLTGKMRARGKFPAWCRGSDSRLSMPDLAIFQNSQSRGRSNLRGAWQD